MRGLVKTRDLVTHGPLIVRLFGLRAYLRCVGCAVRHPGQATFLTALYSCKPPEQSQDDSSTPPRA